MMPDRQAYLFDEDELKRQRLRDHGCHEAAGYTLGAIHWRLPDGEVVSELQAFAWLERQEQTKEP
jgi:hypothetical protein